MDLRLYRTEPPAAVMDGCVAVYASAFGQPPYAEPAADAELLRERVTRYAGRVGFRLPVVTHQDGNVAGFALAVRAFPGDWWRDKVAAAIGPALTARWLPPGVLEVVHVAVHPAWQRQGIGRALLDSLTADSLTAESLTADRRTGGALTAVLSCDSAAGPAQQLYLSSGWTLITGELSYLPGMPARWLMGIELQGA